jgi:hypothetical protein
MLECRAIDYTKRRVLKSPDEISASIEEMGGELFKEPDAFTIISGFHCSMVELSKNY